MNATGTPRDTSRSANAMHRMTCPPPMRGDASARKNTGKDRAAALACSVGTQDLAQAPSDAAFVVHLLGPTLVIGSGIGGAFIAGTQLAVDGVDDADSGLAGGLVNTSQQIGGALGLAILSTVAAARTESLQSAGASAADAMTGGLSWMFYGAAIAAVAASIVAGVVRERR